MDRAKDVLQQIRETKVEEELEEIQEAVEEASQMFGFWTAMKK